MPNGADETTRQRTAGGGIVKAGLILENLGYAAFGLLLPITSLPLLGKLTSSGMVAPAAAPIALGLIMVGLVPRLLRREPLPKVLLPLLGFTSILLFSTVLSLFRDVPPFREQSVLRTGLSALVTLAVGWVFYLAVVQYALRREQAAHLIRWINWGGLVMVLWSLAQALVWRLSGGYPDWMQTLNFTIAPNELYYGRASGLAFEPSWLAHQLNMLYLPLWGGFSLSGTSVHRYRLGFVTLERLLLLGGLAAMVFSVSRVGLLAPLMAVILLGAVFIWGIARRTQQRLLELTGLRGWQRRLSSAGLWLGIGVIFLAFTAGLAYAAALGLRQFDPRMAQMFDLTAIRSGSLAAYANQLVFAERVVYWQAGWQVFAQHPWLGVGLGNAGFYIRETLSSYAWGLTEVRNHLLYSDTLLNSKSLWIRLLAEGGLAGIILYLIWLLANGLSALLLIRRGAFARALGWAGLLGLLALLSEGMSIDSFALPYLWVLFGLVGGLAAGAEKPAD